jgi:predicted RNA-binding protein YlxR (DUF448 family)
MMLAHSQSSAADHGGQEFALDEGPREHAVERLCIATRKVRPVSELIRFVVDPDGAVVPDIKGKLPGRGVWVTATRAALAEALKRKAFGRGFKRDVRIPEDLVERTERLLERGALDALAVAGKAGLVVTGFSRIQAAVGEASPTALIHAAEAGADGVKKLDSAWHSARHHNVATASSPPPIRAFSVTQLDLALGRPNVVHAALQAGPATDTFLARWQRLERFRSGDLRQQTGATAPN